MYAFGETLLHDVEIFSQEKGPVAPEKENIPEMQMNCSADR